MDSLIKRDEQQPELFSRDSLNALFVEQERTPSNPTFTAARFFEVHPEKYHMTVHLLAEGLSTRRIAQLLKVSRNTIAAVEKRERGASIEPQKEVLAHRYRYLAKLIAERLEELILDDDAELSVRDLMVAGGIAIDKSQLLSGGATSRVEYRPGVAPTVDQFNEWLAQLPRADGEVMEIGSGPETGASKGELQDGSAQAGAPASPQPAGGSESGGHQAEARKESDK